MLLEPEKLYRINEAIKLTGLPFSEWTILRRIKSKQIPAIKIKGGGKTGNRYYIKGKDIDNYLNKILNESGTNSSD